MPRFYRMDPFPGEIPAFRVDTTIIEDEPGPADDCPACGRTIGMLNWLEPHVMDLHGQGTSWPDFFRIAGINVILSEAVRDACLAEGIVGFERFEPIRIRTLRMNKRLREPPPNYFLGKVRRGRIRLDEAASKLQRNRLRSGQPPCDVCGGADPRVAEGLFIDLSTWKGEHVFRPENFYSAVVLSQDFVDFLDRHEFAHDPFRPLDQIRFEYKDYTS